MKKNVVFLVLAVFTAALFLTGCQKDELIPQEEVVSDGLFLKSALEGESSSINYIDTESAGKFYFPDNLLFEIKDEGARNINNMLIVEDYHVFSENKEAVFRVKEMGAKAMVIGYVGEKPIYSSHTENVKAFRLPFDYEDIGSQTDSGDSRFNGLLKAGDYVFAIDDKVVMVYDLKSKGILTTTGELSGNSFTFPVNSQVWTLTFMQNSPIGNLFELSASGGKINCYTLIR